MRSWYMFYLFGGGFADRRMKAWCEINGWDFEAFDRLANEWYLHSTRKKL